MDYSALTKQDKQDIFEFVNSTHLHLKGDDKKALKRQFCHVWKINKNIGAFELMMKLYESEKEELEEEKEMMTPQQQAYLDDVIEAANVLIALKETKMTVVEPTEEEVEAATGLLGLKDAIQEEDKTNETETLKKRFTDLFNISNAFRSIPRRTAVPSRMTPLRGQGKPRKTKKRMTKRKLNKKNKRRKNTKTKEGEAG